MLLTGRAEILRPSRLRSVMGALMRQGALSRVHVLIYVYLLASMAVIDFALERYTVSRLETLQQQEVMEQANSLRARLESNILARALQLRGIAAAMTTAPNLTAEQFAEIATLVSGDDPMVVAISSAPDLVINHIHPHMPYGNQIGQSFESTPEQMQAIRRAITERKTVLDGPVTLLNGAEGFVLRAPVFTRAPGQSESRFWGIMSASLDQQQLLAQSGLFAVASQLDVSLMHPAEGQAPATVFYGPPMTPAMRPVTLQIALPDGAWTMAVYPVGGWSNFPEARQQIRFWMLLVTVLGVVIAIYFLELNRRKSSAEQNLLSAINAISEGFALYDDQDRLVLFNDGYKRQFGEAAAKLEKGLSFEQAIKLSATHWQDQLGIDVEARIAARIRDHQNPQRDSEEQLPDGSWIKMSDRRTRDGWTVCLRTDITELKQAKLHAEAANRAKTEFLNVMTHELRTPLTVVLGYNAFLMKPENLPANLVLQQVLEDPTSTRSEIRHACAAVTDVVSRFGTKMDAAGQHLLALIQDTLDYAKIEEGKMVVLPEPLPVRPILESVIDQFQNQAKQKGIDLWAEADEVDILADETRLKQVLFNLVGNAIKFTDRGEVSIQTELLPGFLRFTVTDTGCGIPEAEFTRIFDSFHQIEDVNVRRAGGTGLGLAITRQLVTLHRGQITVESTPGEGSRFSFTIPLAGA